MVKKGEQKIAIDDCPVETTGTCGFTKECRERTKDGECTWKAGCAYRNVPPVKDGYKLEVEKVKS